ncbi:phage tail fiber protein [Providencia sp. wls1914]|uniref:phage tail fiber protein n=1 Tax=Providencia sp. wls1914 TaxID=2675156 RepID=UPI0012B5C8ED|nr:hypothetical protein [Providencia sp. wls1914]MTC72282.1 hypothetical protein [Providencia sp. wls1914]
MIYQTGTITTTAGQTKIKGTGTRWKDNLNGISEGCPISYLINNVVYMNTVLSVNSDTEINLTYPVPVAASAAKYQIATFVLDSMSDGVRKMLANQQYIQYFLRNMDTWMTQDGIVEIKTPTGETVKLESIIALKKLINGKATLATNSVQYFDGEIRDKTSIGVWSADNKNALMVSLVRGTPDFYYRVNDVTYYITMPSGSGTLMKVGDFGLGNSGISGEGAVDNYTSPVGFYHMQENMGTPPQNISGSWAFIQAPAAYPSYRSQLAFSDRGSSSGTLFIRSFNAGKAGDWAKFYHDKNTTKDANGNLKAASPIIKVFADHIELNDESDGVTLKKLHTGIYQLHGVLGMHPDASWGGVHGGITIPCGINQLPLVYALYDVLEKGKPHPFDGRIVEPEENGDIVLYTTYRKHDLPQNIQYERFKLYPEFLKEVDGEMVELTPGEPCDIPNGHWIDVRVNMPSDSIYNQKLAEAERLAKLEAERLAEEEAKRAAEEAERAEQEATERKQYDLGDNDTLL